jgi:hypothetical protein
MDFISGLIVVCFFLIIAYFYSQNKILTTENTIKLFQKENKELAKESQDLLRKASIINKVNEFLQHALFLEKIGFWQENIIYKYIFNKGYLYEFYETLSKKQDKIGIDEEFLCFHQMCYKRVINTADFIQKFESEILNKKS